MLQGLCNTIWLLTLIKTTVVWLQTLSQVLNSVWHEKNPNYLWSPVFHMKVYTRTQHTPGSHYQNKPKSGPLTLLKAFRTGTKNKLQLKVYEAIKTRPFKVEKRAWHISKVHGSIFSSNTSQSIRCSVRAPTNLYRTKKMRRIKKIFHQLVTLEKYRLSLTLGPTFTVPYLQTIYYKCLGNNS